MSLLMYVNCKVDESFSFESQNLRGFKPLGVALASLYCKPLPLPNYAAEPYCFPPVSLTFSFLHFFQHNDLTVLKLGQ